MFNSLNVGFFGGRLNSSSDIFSNFRFSRVVT